MRDEWKFAPGVWIKFTINWEDKIKKVYAFIKELLNRRAE
jgi:hypothetical protein